MLKPHTFVRSVNYALKGFSIAWNEEQNFKIELFLGILAVLFGLILHFTATEWLVLTLTIALVLISELLNTALEELCDIVKIERDPHIAKIKDLAAAAVFSAGVGAIIVGALLFLPHLV